MPVIVDGEFRRPGYLSSFAVVEGAEHWLANWTPKTVGREHPTEAGTVRGHDPVHDDGLRSDSVLHDADKASDGGSILHRRASELHYHHILASLKSALSL